MPVPYIDEKAAKVKWCPYALKEWRGKSYNRTSDAAGHGVAAAQCECLGSACAKWDVESKFGELTGRGRCGA